MMKVDSPQEPPGFAEHLSRYLIAWALCVAGDWLCGPGVYALYASYGFTPEQNAQLYVLGFASSSILGCFAGRLADSYGRKRAALLFSTAGVTSCLLMHVRCMPVLYVARILDGVRTSLLYTVFESWLVSEHVQRHAFPPELLGHTFALMYSTSYFSAILCGLVSQVGVDAVPQIRVGDVRFGRWGVPCELSALSQALGCLFIAVNWSENYSRGREGAADVAGGLWSAVKKPGVMICGLVVSCFESSMFIFVFSWTPALAADGDESELPCGIIFAVFMAACMAGATTNNWIFKRFAGTVRNSALVAAIISLAATAMAVPAFCGVSERTAAFNFAAFVVFQFCTGAYFPAAGALKSECVDEAHRTTIYNMFRTPMNCVVIAVILYAPSPTDVFRLIFAMLSLAAVCVGAWSCFGLWRWPVHPKDQLLLQDTLNTPLF